MTSPGRSSVKVVMYSIRVGISKIMRSVVVFCNTVPLSRVVNSNWVGSPSSSDVTIHGPKPPVAGKFLPAVHWMVWFCQSRTEPSL